MGCSSSKEAVPSSSASQKKGTPVSPSAKHGSEGIAAQDNMVRSKINFIRVDFLIFNPPNFPLFSIESFFPKKRKTPRRALATKMPNSTMLSSERR